MAFAAFAAAPRDGFPEFSEREVRILASLEYSHDLAPPASPSNRFADDRQAAEFGRQLFFDKRLSKDGSVSCASCHRPELYFTDGRERSFGFGETLRNAPTVVGSAFGDWFYWDGRRDTLWAQALIPFEAADEMGSSRIEVVLFVGRDRVYRERYEAIFGAFPDTLLSADLPRKAGPYADKLSREAWHRIRPDHRKAVNTAYANLGKAIAAYERTLRPQRTRFDEFVRLIADEGPGAAAESGLLSPVEARGAKLFIDDEKSRCMRCHNGPQLTNGGFHNIGSGNFTGDRLDYGRVFGLRAVLMDEFNCVGPYSDAEPDQCVELRFLNKDTHIPLEGAFKVPTLRGVSRTGPYFHDGRFRSLSDVLEFYNEPAAENRPGPTELTPLELSDPELADLEAFLRVIGE